MSDEIFPVDPAWAARAYVNEAGYRAKYAESVADPEAFWAREGHRLDWMRPYTRVKDVSYDPENLPIRW